MRRPYLRYGTPDSQIFRAPSPQVGGLCHNGGRWRGNSPFGPQAHGLFRPNLQAMVKSGRVFFVSTSDLSRCENPAFPVHYIANATS